MIREESQIKLSGNLPLKSIFLKGGGGLVKNTTQTSKSVCFCQKLAGLWKKIQFTRYFLKGSYLYLQNTICDQHLTIFKSDHFLHSLFFRSKLLDSMFLINFWVKGGGVKLRGKYHAT